MKAWGVNDWNRDKGAVVFAETRGKARAEGAAEIDSEFTAVECVRAPLFDELYPGPITPVQYLARGWRWRCPARLCRVEWITEDTAVYDGEEVYCSEACRDKAKGETL